MHIAEHIQTLKTATQTASQTTDSQTGTCTPWHFFKKQHAVLKSKSMNISRPTSSQFVPDCPEKVYNQFLAALSSRLFTSVGFAGWCHIHKNNVIRFEQFHFWLFRKTSHGCVVDEPNRQGICDRTGWNLLKHKQVGSKEVVVMTTCSDMRLWKRTERLHPYDDFEGKGGIFPELNSLLIFRFRHI